MARSLETYRGGRRMAWKRVNDERLVGAKRVSWPNVNQLFARAFQAQRFRRRKNDNKI